MPRPVQHTCYSDGSELILPCRCVSATRIYRRSCSAGRQRCQPLCSLEAPAHPALVLIVMAAGDSHRYAIGKPLPVKRRGDVSGSYVGPDQVDHSAGMVFTAVLPMRPTRLCWQRYPASLPRRYGVKLGGRRVVRNSQNLLGKTSSVIIGR